jgi:hypothetical protein
MIDLSDSRILVYAPWGGSSINAHISIYKEQDFDFRLVSHRLVSSGNIAHYIDSLRHNILPPYAFAKETRIYLPEEELPDRPNDLSEIVKSLESMRDDPQLQEWEKSAKAGREEMRKATQRIKEKRIKKMKKEPSRKKRFLIWNGEDTNET